ncbi:MAG: MotA/TolQ/ExbB proton channel family protein [Muribaculaceae bacterium]|nr:MotA/TolQ/ExbB proton channel family protein [Muribaculaceae bacterium]
MLLLDAALTGTPAAAQAAATAATQELSLWDLCLRGGPLMIPIALLSLVCVYVFVERALVIHRASREDATFMRRIRDYVHEGELESAHNLCKKNGSPYARLIDRGLSRIGRPVNDILAAVENTGNIEVATLSKGLPWLATTAAGAPMLGFLGTVVGMVQAFYDIASAGNSANIATFSSGIYTALVTTVAGLVVGVIALFGYNYLVARVNSVMNLLEQKSMEFMDLLNEPA